MRPQKIFTRDFVLSFFAQFTFSFVFSILIPTIPIYLSQVGAKEAEIGVLVGIFSVSSLVLRPFVGRALLRISERDFMIAGTLLYAFSSITYLFAKPFWPFLIVRILQGAGLALFATASFKLVIRISPETHRGQSIGYFYLAINIAFALAPSFGMALINLFNFPILFLVCTGLSLCSLFITTKLNERPIDSFENQFAKNQPLLSREAFPPALIASMVNIVWGALTERFFPCMPWIMVSEIPASFLPHSPLHSF